MTKKRITTYNDLGELFAGVAEKVFVPPRRMTVSEWAAEDRYINQPGAYVGDWENETVPYMVEPSDVLTDTAYKGCVFAGPAQCAKALPLDTPIPTPGGWATMADVKPGGWVIGDDGRPVRVLGESEIFYGNTVYEIAFDDGTTIRADAGHLWTVRDLKMSHNAGRGVYRTITTQEIKEHRVFGIGRNRFAVDNTKPLQFRSADLPVDPYVLGAWLGDGHSYSAWIYAAKGVDADHITTQLRATNYDVALVESKPGVMTIKPGSDRSGYTLRERLRHAGLLANKHIPVAYLRASYPQRLALFQGLLDTDGTISSKGAVSFTTTRQALFDGFMELARTLGFKPKFSFDGYSWQIRITAYSDIPVFRMARKAARLNPIAEGRSTESRARFIVSVTEVSSVPVKCILVDNATHLFLAGEQMVPTHNTDALIVNWIGYSATTDPQDMIVYSPSFNAARDFSMRRVDRLHRHTEQVGKSLVSSKDADNKFDKHYTNGMLLSLSWPTVSELAGKPIGRVALTDYDRIDDDIGGDGNAFDLASKRTTTFGSFAMTLAESSPSRPITDYKKVTHGHAAPPTTGILSLYNRGDRRRWYWPCPDCGSYFEGRWEHIKWDEEAGSNLDKADTAYMECPHCAHAIQPQQRRRMNLDGVWLKDGQRIVNDRIVGKGRKSDIASFWLMGVAAGLTTWKNLVKSFLDAEDEYESTGEETALQKFFNTDIGVPYVPKNVANDNTRLPETLMGRVEPWTKRKVPKNVRFLLGVVDVQQHSFVVQIIGVAPGKPYDLYLVDRFSIRYSDRIDPSSPAGQENRMFIQPGAYLEDWDKITEQVMKAQYDLDDDSGRRMAVKLTLCDSGGKAGVTTRAYDFYRKIVRDGFLGRFQLVKGASEPSAPRAQIRRPDADKKAGAGARGEIPVLFLNPTINKDDLHNRLDVLIPGYGMIHLPSWLISTDKKEDMSWFFPEMTSEMREPGKGWVKVARRNEAWDLFYYTIGACASSLLNVERVDWGNPPPFAAPWDENPLVISANDNEAFEDRSNFDWKALGQAMG